MFVGWYCSLVLFTHVHVCAVYCMRGGYAGHYFTANIGQRRVLVLYLAGGGVVSVTLAAYGGASVKWSISLPH